MGNNSPNDKTGSSVPHVKKAADGHEYHVSSTANATVAPTNAATLDNAIKGGKGLDQDQREFLTILDYEWNMLGKLDPEQIRTDYGIPEDLWQAYTHNQDMLEALKLRGVPTKGLNPADDSVTNSDPVGSLTPASPNFHAKLTPIQLVVANSILDLADTRSDKKKLQDVGCTTTQYQAWLRDPEFKGYLQSRAESLIGDIQHEAMLSLADRVKSGDMKAIEYYHEITGRFVRQTQSNSTGPDLGNTIVRIIEIIQDEVEDPETAFRISKRLKGLIAGNQIAASLANPEPIVAPEIATPRTITPEIQALMNRGLGYDS